MKAAILVLIAVLTTFYTEAVYVSREDLSSMEMMREAVEYCEETLTSYTNGCLQECIMTRVGYMDDDGYPNVYLMTTMEYDAEEEPELFNCMISATNNCLDTVKQGAQATGCYKTREALQCQALAYRDTCNY